MKWSERQLLRPSAPFVIPCVTRIHKNCERSLAPKTLTIHCTLDRVFTKDTRLLCHHQKKKKKKKKKLPFWCKVNKRCVFCLAIVMWIGQVICNLQTRDEFDKDRRVKTKLKINGSMLHGLINGIWNYCYFFLVMLDSTFWSSTDLVFAILMKLNGESIRNITETTERQHTERIK